MTTTHAQQAASLETAENWGETWTSADFELLEACADVPAIEIAACLGRTLYAVQMARKASTSRPRPEGAHTPSPQPTRVKGGQRWLASADLYWP